uniref:Purple acid phosphatase C-terminal domain-containing protein n=2 Tax=Palpitomonas bilix TaxID=652834 RepID=A0A7S3G393_9EUKA|mmetsp:Transcript_255/g.325  ORF Transcript_255/g.325 Transcript_255/m.325 type:complete len:101 (+) Transcript_255:185-487(+)
MYNFTCVDGFTNTTDIKVKKGYPVHVVVGMAGNTSQSAWKSYMPEHFMPPDWIVFRSADFGFTYAEATSTTLAFKYVNDQDGVVHDHFTLHKGSDWDEGN